jgi:hypothetical protein
VSYVEEALCAVSALDDERFSNRGIEEVVSRGFNLLGTDEWW